ncbi:hypothetical protein JD844_011748 [Phrynosoma platyrhinos]|uniref:TBC1 domain family member 24 n=1 Tax=Phrynosoma platyrhinos TaxID=52577 RepID=A0ABQ7TIT8_PHRPL|nr:hypothetical protein JD844_011748 [Phrynosoma platyrhinos]
MFTPNRLSPSDAKEASSPLQPNKLRTGAELEPGDSSKNKMLHIGLSYTSLTGAPTAGFSLEKTGASERTNSIMDEVQENNLECSQDGNKCVTTVEVEMWNSASTSCRGCSEFVDHNKIPKWNEKQDSREQLHGKSTKELKKMAREGCWARSHALRAEAYQLIIQDLPCRLMTPDATVYKDVASKLFGSQSESVEPIPEFLAGSIMPEYCLTEEGVCAVKKILICISSLYPDITYCPLLPAVTALLLHYSHSEAQCFENTCRLLYCKAPHTSYIDYSFLAYEASCMTFGDLANKHCPAAHRLIASSSDNIFEVYSEWLVWLFGDLPFDYVIRIFDVYLLEGQKVLYRIALALMRQYQLSVASKGLEVADIKGSLQAFITGLIILPSFSLLCRQSFHLTVNAHDFTSTIVTVQEMRIVWSWIPERFSLFSPILLFSTSEDGYSLQRFYSCCEGYEPTVLLIKTTLGEVSVHPEIERYEWVFIKKPEQAKALPRSPRQRSPSPFSPERRSTPSPNHLTVPKLDMIKNRLSPFLAIRHFKLPSKTASMFMSGTQEGIIIGAALRSLGLSKLLIIPVPVVADIAPHNLAGSETKDIG